jgi:hypothetical protein
MVRVLVALAPRLRRYPRGELTLQFAADHVDARLSEWLSAKSLAELV